MTVAELRLLTVRLREARNAGRWQTEMNLWASLSEALDDLESDEWERQK
jgi:hypothetical protein